MTTVINIALDYTPFPGGRYAADGKGNGTTFRDTFLVPAMKDEGTVTIILDGAVGYPSSFLEEAFGGLVRAHHFSPEEVERKFSFVATQPGFSRYIPMIKSYIHQATQKNKNVA